MSTTCLLSQSLHGLLVDVGGWDPGHGVAVVGVAVARHVVVAHGVVVTPGLKKYIGLM